VASLASRETKDRVRQAVNIVDLIGGYVSLRRAGRNFQGLCPFHDDSKPSLQVNAERQSWRCWVCAIGGDVFSFLMQKEGISFPEALAMLAEKAGIPLEQGSREQVQERASEKAELYRVCAWAEQQFHEELLRGPAAAKARDYVTNRGINTASTGRFRLGYSPTDWSWLINRGRTAGFSLDLLEAAGFVSRSSQDNRAFDRFRDRLLFPVHDPQGRPIAFGGRVLPSPNPTSDAKYLNSPGTKLFSKSEQLYALDLAKEAAQKTRHIIVVEGYTDVVMLHQYGLTNVVAVLGTALTEKHLPVLRRYVDRVTLLLDGDEAGRRRTNDILELFVSSPIDLRVLTLPDDLDPCDFVRERGLEKLEELLEGAVDALEHKVRVATQGIDLFKDTHAASAALEDILDVLSKGQTASLDSVESRRIKEQQLLRRLSREFGVTEDALRTRMSQLRSRKPQSNPTAQMLPVERKTLRAADLPPADSALLELLVGRPELAGEIFEQVDPVWLKSQEAKQLIEAFRTAHFETGDSSFEAVLSEIQNPAIQYLLVELDEESSKKAPVATLDAMTQLKQWIERHQHRQDEAEARKVNAALTNKTLDEEEALRLSLERLEKKRQRQGIPSPKDG
jgi:DNA primase